MLGIRLNTLVRRKCYIMCLQYKGRIVWTAGWVEPCNKWIMLIILGHHPRMVTIIYSSEAPDPMVGNNKCQVIFVIRNSRLHVKQAIRNNNKWHAKLAIQNNRCTECPKKMIHKI